MHFFVTGKFQNRISSYWFCKVEYGDVAINVFTGPNNLMPIYATINVRIVVYECCAAAH